MKESTAECMLQKSAKNGALRALCIELNLHKSLRHLGMAKNINRGLQAVSGVAKVPCYWEQLQLPKNYFANIIDSVFETVSVGAGFRLEDARNLFDANCTLGFSKMYNTCNKYRVASISGLNGSS
ncbi:hypothetical protein BGX26_000803 [Mortierella sp. AD094]|nr:hypothetical protein BGX26_000803 [Mortierella sp. AD094]